MTDLLQRQDDLCSALNGPNSNQQKEIIKVLIKNNEQEYQKELGSCKELRAECKKESPANIQM